MFSNKSGSRWTLITHIKQVNDVSPFLKRYYKYTTTLRKKICFDFSEIFREASFWESVIRISFQQGWALRVKKPKYKLKDRLV